MLIVANDMKIDQQSRQYFTDLLASWNWNHLEIKFVDELQNTKHPAAVHKRVELGYFLWLITGFNVYVGRNALKLSNEARSIPMQ